MKLVASREALHRGFSRVGSVISSSIQQPLYRNVRIEAADGALHVAATDLEVQLTLRVDSVEVQEDGVVLLPHARITPILAATPEDQVTMVEDGGAVTIQAGGSVFRLLGEDPTDFPDTPSLPTEGVVEIDAETLKYMVRRTVFAVAEEKGRYALNGVFFVLGKDGTLEMVAADGARMAQVTKKAVNPDGVAMEFIVMARGVEQLARLADCSKEPVRFAVSQNKLVAENDVGRMACLLVEGQFPNYKEVIPAEGKVKVQLPTRDLLSAVRRASYMTTDETRVVDFEFADGTLTITAESPDVGRAEVKVPIEYDGAAAQIAFNPEFLEEMLNVVERESVKMTFTDRRSPCVLRSGLDFCYVVSPVIREEGEL